MISCVVCVIKYKHTCIEHGAIILPDLFIFKFQIIYCINMAHLDSSYQNI
jgi:hypothetical protein